MKKIFQAFFARTDLTLTTAWTFSQLAFAIVYPFIPVYFTNERRIPYDQVGAIFPLLGLVTICSPFLIGPATDRLGRTFMILFGQFARGVCFLVLACLTYFSAPFWWCVAVLMFNTAVGNAFQVGADAYLSDITTEEERPAYYSKIRIGFNLGWSLGPMIGAFFAKVPFWLFFVITAFLCFLGGVFTSYVLSYNRKHLDLEQKKKTACQEKKDAGSEGENKRMSFCTVLKQILTNRQLCLLLCGIFLLFCLTSQLYSTLSVYATGRVGIGKSALGMIYSMNAAIVILLQIPVTKWLTKRHISLKYQLLLGTLFYIFGYFLLGLCFNSGMIAGCVVLLTLGEIVIMPAVYAATTRECVTENAGRILAVFSTIRGAGYAIGPWFGAQIFERFSSPVVLWGALSAFAAASLIFFGFLANEKNASSSSDGEKEAHPGA